MDIQKKLEHSLGKPVSQAENRELYSALLSLFRKWRQAENGWMGKRKFITFRRNF